MVSSIFGPGCEGRQVHPRGLSPRRLERRDAGAYSATVEPLRARWRPRDRRGLLLGTRVRRFWARSAFQRPRSPTAPRDRIIAGTPYSPVETVVCRTTLLRPVTAAIGRQGLLELVPQQGFVPGAVRCHVRCWIQTPRHGSDARIVRSPANAGISIFRACHPGICASKYPGPRDRLLRRDQLAHLACQRLFAPAKAFDHGCQQCTRL